jgi:hypothetical protein
MKPSMSLVLAALGGGVAGAVLMSIAAKQQQAQALATQQALANQILNNPQPTLQLASSTTSLNVGWIYYVTVQSPNVDLTVATNQTSVAAAIQAAGFVDPTSKGAPTLQVSTTATDTATAFTVYNGSQGGSVPASTSTLKWVNVLGYPQPEGLSTA